MLSFLVSAAGAVGFAVTYGLGGNTRWEGVCLAVAFAGLATGLATWGGDSCRPAGTSRSTRASPRPRWSRR